MSRINAVSAALVASVLTLTVMVVVNQSGARSEATARSAAKAGQVSDPYAGIPQDGLSLGRKDAPLTLVEFADLQCPFCRDYAVNVLPQIVDRYVRSGELRLELRVLRFLGPDSVSAAAGAAAAAQGNRLWQFADLFYQRQGQENSGYVTHDFLHGTAADSGLDPQRFAREMDDARAERMARHAEHEAELLGVTGTPSFFIGRTGGPMRPVSVSALDFGQFATAVEAAR
jgi:protein-disulfide isomerase